MTARPKDIGTAAETAVVRALRQLGFPHAERRALTGSLDQGDVTGCPGLVFEVKGGNAAKTASDGQVEKWLDETECERVNAGADFGLLVMARAGIGPANAERWWAVSREYVGPSDREVVIRTTLADACLRLRSWGYGERLDAGIVW